VGAVGLRSRTKRLERVGGLDRGRQRPASSRTEREAHSLDAEIREIVEQMQVLGADPDEWRHAGARAGLSLEEHITAIERELDDDDDY
jgi:hypothetical protein